MEIKPTQEIKENTTSDYSDLDFSILSETITEKTSAEPTTSFPTNLPEKISDYRNTMVDTYNASEFPDLVGDLKAKLQRYAIPRLCPDFISEGTQSAVFSIYDSNGEHYAVRLPEVCSYRYKKGGIDNYLENFALGYGLEGLEQPVAASLEDNVVVSPFLPGTTIDCLKRDDYKNLKAEHIQKLANNISSAIDHGVSFDVAPQNFIFDKQTGITAIDYVKMNPNFSNDKAGTLVEIYESIIGNDSRFNRFKPNFQQDILEEFHEGVAASEHLESSNKNNLHGWIGSAKRI